MNFSLLVQLCGVPLLIVIGILAVLLIAMALYLVFSAKRQDLLAAFLPLTLLPALAGLLVTFLESLTSIGLQLDSTTKITIEPGFLLQMNLIPLLTGLVAAAPSAVIAIAGRWILAWQSSGIALLPKRSNGESSDSDDRGPHEAWVAKETDDYLEKLVRPR